jgi:hypothetical protein
MTDLESQHSPKTVLECVFETDGLLFGTGGAPPQAVEVFGR